MVYAVAQRFEPTFPIELYNIYQWTYAKNKQQCRRQSQCNTKFSYKYASSYLETDTSLNEGKDFSKKALMSNEEMNQQAKNIYNTMNKRF